MGLVNEARQYEDMNDGPALLNESFTPQMSGSEATNCKTIKMSTQMEKSKIIPVI
jgi:hypothetical protein